MQLRDFMRTCIQLITRAIKGSMRIARFLQDRPTLLIGIAFLALFSGMLFMLEPARTGYAFVKEFEMMEVDGPHALQKMETLNTNNALLEKELKSTKVLVESLREQLNEEREKLFTAQQATQEIERKLRLLNQEFDYQVDKAQKVANVNVEVARAGLTQCQQEKEDMRKQHDQTVNDYKKTIDTMQENHENLIEKMQEAYDEVTGYSGYNICCKNKVDDPRIDSYSVINGRVFCGIGKDHRISCPS